VTPERRNLARKLLAGATPGPWSTERPAGAIDGFSRGIVVAATPGRQKIYADPPGGSYPWNDCRLIAASPGLLTEALDEIDALERELAACRAERDSYLAAGAISGAVQMGPAEEPPGRRGRQTGPTQPMRGKR
jgi:hypothetical protein